VGCYHSHLGSGAYFSETDVRAHRKRPIWAFCGLVVDPIVTVARRKLDLGCFMSCDHPDSDWPVADRCYAVDVQLMASDGDRAIMREIMRQSVGISMAVRAIDRTDAVIARVKAAAARGWITPGEKWMLGRQLLALRDGRKSALLVERMQNLVMRS
jgi:hypothetical protein